MTLVRMKTGDVEDLVPEVARMFILSGRADEYEPAKPQTQEQALLNAENVGGPAGIAGIEQATLFPKARHAVIEYLRGPRSRR